MTNWKTVRIGDHIKIKHGYAFEGEGISDIDNENILVTPGNFDIGGGFKSNKFKFYSGSIPDEYIFQTQDLIVTMTDLSKEGDTLGYPAFIPSSSKYTYLHNQRVGKVILEDDFFNKNFLYYLLCTDEYRNEVLASATGTSIKHTSPKRIESFSASVPMEAEQKAIAVVLRALDDKIDLNRRMNVTLEAMARVLFKSWFIDFDPVRAKMEGKQPFGMNAATAALFPSTLIPSTLSDIPEGWTIDEIGNVVTAVGGSTPSTEKSEYWVEGLHAWATPKDLSNLKSPVLLSTERKITDAGMSVISSGLLPAGTVLMSSRAPIGYIAIPEVPVAINQGFIAMVCNKKLPNLYVWLWTHNNLDTIKNHSNGSTFQEISKGSFRPLPCIVPTDPVLQKFQEIVSPLWQKIVSNTKEAVSLEKQRDYLLPKLVSGDIRIPDAEKFVEGLS